MTPDQDLDRTREATPHKLAEARKRGSVPRSADLQSFVVVCVLTAALFALAPTALRRLSLMLANGLASVGLASVGLASVPQVLHSPDSVAAAMRASLVDALSVLAPIFFVLVVAVTLAGVLQTGGLVFSSAPIKPDLERLNPVAGFKRFFSAKLLFEAVKSALKFAVLLLVAFASLNATMHSLAPLTAASAKSLLFTVLDSACSLTTKLCLALGMFALVDLVYSRWDFLRNMRMSRREQEDELKHRDGDPRIRARLRELRQEYLRRARSVTRVSGADVLITNPTRIAVALRYEHGVSPAPQVIAKGTGAMARRMRDVAFRARVPIVHSPVLARALYKEVSQDNFLPERWYPQVAKILVWVKAARAARYGFPTDTAVPR